MKPLALITSLWRKALLRGLKKCLQRRQKGWSKVSHGLLMTTVNMLGAFWTPTPVSAWERNVNKHLTDLVFTVHVACSSFMAQVIYHLWNIYRISMQVFQIIYTHKVTHFSDELNWCVCSGLTVYCSHGDAVQCAHMTCTRLVLMCAGFETN